MDTLIIVGLGNPGPEYTHTRHNLGFLTLDYLAQAWGAPAFREEKKFSAEIAEIRKDGRKILLVKPTTFMNESGKSVRALLDFYKLSPAALAVLHDELDIAPGSIKTTASSRSAGHNGVQDIIDNLGTQDFFRIRIGIGRPVETEGVCLPAHDYVLGRLSDDELKRLPDIYTEVEKTLETFLKQKTGV